MGHVLKRRKSIECDPRVNQMLELKDKDINVVIKTFLSDTHDE